MWILQKILILIFTLQLNAKKQNATNNNELCNSEIDALLTFITFTNDTEGFVFKGDKFWRLTKKGIAPGYPRLIASHFGGQLPNNIDAAFNDGGSIFIFKGDKYWEYGPFARLPEVLNEDEETPSKRYTGYISEEFTGIPNNIDAAFFLRGNYYFIKGDKYWKCKLGTKSDPKPTCDPSPRLLSPFMVEQWAINIDAALPYKGRIIFFKDDKFWSLEKTGNFSLEKTGNFSLEKTGNFSVVEASPSYPRNAGKWWFGCGDQSDESKSTTKFIVEVVPPVKEVAGPLNEDDFVCPSDGLFPDPSSDCRAYFRCQGDQTWRFNCSTALKFDARQKFCKDEGDVNDNCNAFFTIYTEDEVFDLRANDY